MKQKFVRLFYRATSNWKRPMPRDAQDWATLKQILVDYFDVPDSPEVWVTVAGHMNSIPANRIHVSYMFLASVAKRLKINTALQVERLSHKDALEQKLKNKMQELANSMQESKQIEEVLNASDESPEPKLINQPAVSVDIAVNRERFATNPIVQG